MTTEQMTNNTHQPVQLVADPTLFATDVIGLMGRLSDVIADAIRIDPSQLTTEHLDDLNNQIAQKFKDAGLDGSGIKVKVRQISDDRLFLTLHTAFEPS